MAKSFECIELKAGSKKEFLEVVDINSNNTAMRSMNIKYDSKV